MAVSGVRSSWETLATNSARTRSSRRSSVTSCSTRTTPGPCRAKGTATAWARRVRPLLPEGGRRAMEGVAQLGDLAPAGDRPPGVEVAGRHPPREGLHRGHGARAPRADEEAGGERDRHGEESSDLHRPAEGRGEP